ncbi:MAG: hypothetical protein GQ534_07550 [Candidatus Delongbacteria bacterium]|nr:hypothetical protein [Candidatus Delongbacteria bacterium]
MDTATINWMTGVYQFGQLNVTGNHLLDDNGFYAIYAARWNSNVEKYDILDLLYIGQAFGQSLRTRISQDHDSAYDCIEKIMKNDPDVVPVFKVGTITQYSLSRITQEFIDDIESCLIFRNQPKCNTQNMIAYNGRVIGVTNEGDYPMLKQYLQCGEYNI